MMDAANWLLFSQDGQNVVVFSSILSTDAKSQGAVLSHPVEQGSFLSYNKTRSPVSIEVTLGVEGNSLLQSAALATLAHMQKNTGKLTFSTPGALYTDLTLASYSYARSLEKGANLLAVTLTLVEVREVTARVNNLYFPSPQNPTSDSRVSTGSTQTQDPSPAAQARMNL